MSQEQTTKPKTKKYSKQAFIESAATTKERLEFEVVLTDGESYTREQALKLVSDWKKKEVK